MELNYGVLGFSTLLQWLGISLLQLLLFYGLASFCAVLTGHKVVLVAVYAVLNFLVVVVESLVREIITALIYGFSSAASLVMEWLSPVYALWYAQFSVVDGMGNTYDYVDSTLSGVNGVHIIYDNWLYLGLCAVAGVLLTVAALLIFRRRHMETATDVVAVRAIRPVFKYVMTFASALILGDLLYTLFFYSLTANVAVVMAGCVLFSAALGYFAAEMLIHKTYRVLKKSWRGFAVSAIILILAIMACRMDVFGVASKIPEPQDVQSVSIQVGGDSVITSEEGIADVLRLHRSIIGNKTLYEELARSSDYYTAWYVTIRYELGGGRSLDRSYLLYVTEEMQQDRSSDIHILNEIVNSAEAVLSRNKLEDAPSIRSFSYGYVDYTDENGNYGNYTLTAREALDLYNEGILPDLQNGNLGTVDLLSSAYTDTPSYLYLEFTDGSTDVKYNPSYLSLEIGPEAQNTIDYLRDVLGIHIF